VISGPGDVGAHFRITLAAADAPSIPQVAEDQERTEPNGNVLFIDDDKNQLRSYRRYFERYFHVFQADNADEVMNMLSVRSDFNAIVMDILMPEADGMKLFRSMVEKYPAVKDRIVFVAPPGLEKPTRDLVSQSGRILLHKPLELDSLASILAFVVRR
jgi:DNA-binding NtrC family response regulator